MRGGYCPDMISQMRLLQGKGVGCSQRAVSVVTSRRRVARFPRGWQLVIYIMWRLANGVGGGGVGGGSGADGPVLRSTVRPRPTLGPGPERGRPTETLASVWAMGLALAHPNADRTQSRAASWSAGARANMAVKGGGERAPVPTWPPCWTVGEVGEGSELLRLSLVGGGGS